MCLHNHFLKHPWWPSGVKVDFFLGAFCGGNEELQHYFQLLGVKEPCGWGVQRLEPPLGWPSPSAGAHISFVIIVHSSKLLQCQWHSHTKTHSFTQSINMLSPSQFIAQWHPWKRLFTGAVLTEVWVGAVVRPSYRPHKDRGQTLIYNMVHSSAPRLLKLPAQCSPGTFSLRSCCPPPHTQTDPHRSEQTCKKGHIDTESI